MFDKIIKYTVYALSLLIITALFAVIYGMYIKISYKSPNNYEINKIVSLSLNSDQEIKNMQIINNNRILITVGNDIEIQGIIFDIETQKIIQRIEK